MVRRVYPNPPIDEAICQVTFAHPVEWTITTPGQLYERFKDRYAGTPRMQRPIQANLAAGQQDDLPSFSVAPGPARIQLFSEDGKRLITVGAETAGVASLRPYEGWEALKPRFDRDMADLFDFFGVEELQATSLRYINRIAVKELPVRLEEFFTHFALEAIEPSPFSGSVTGFFYRTEMQKAEEQTRLATTLASVASEDESAQFLLDLDLVRVAILDLAEASKTLDRLKIQENDLFESLITEKCRRLFE